MLPRDAHPCQTGRSANHRRQRPEQPFSQSAPPLPIFLPLIFLPSAFGKNMEDKKIELRDSQEIFDTRGPLAVTPLQQHLAKLKRNTSEPCEKVTVASSYRILWLASTHANLHTRPQAKRIRREKSGRSLLLVRASTSQGRWSVMIGPFAVSLCT